MASAMISGLVRSTKVAHTGVAIQVLEPSPAQRELLQTQFNGISVVATTEQLAPATIIVLAVKPQIMQEVCTALHQTHSWVRQALVVSIAAGTLVGSMAQWLGQHDRIARAMPNTPALIGMGIAGLFGTNLRQQDQDHASAILSSVGKVIWFDTEAKLDAVTAVSGSGPAYSFYFLEAMQKAGEQLGLSSQDAKALAVQTMKGAVHLAEQSPDSLTTLRERVTSKGGTTAAALSVMAQEQVEQKIVLALKAAAQRAYELGRS